MEDGMGPNTAERQVYSFTDAEQIRQAAAIIRQEADAIHRLADSLPPSFCDAIRLLLSMQGRVIVTGVGKAGLIGRKIVATLSSTGTPAYFMHPTEAVHGDLGCASSGDVVLALSNSGQSEEVVRLMPILRRLDVPVIAITRDTDNQLANAADTVIPLGRHSEAGHLALAPSCSTTAMLALGDALALVLSQARGFTADDFALRHPAGRLGMDLKQVGEVMRTGSQLRIAWELETVRTVLVEHHQPGRRTGAVMLVSERGQLTGLFTDSDLARLFENRRDAALDQPIRQVMTAEPTTTHSEQQLRDAVHLMSQRKLSELPVVDTAGRPVGLLDITDVLQCVDAEHEQTPTESAPLSESHITLARSA
jgi:arabinose-5-phosphate isomerase